jgi:hypothetical protein
MMTSLIRLVVPSSTPFMSETIGAVSGSADPQPEVGAQRLGRDREDDDVGPGRASCGSVLARMPSGRRIPGR